MNRKLSYLVSSMVLALAIGGWGAFIARGAPPATPTVAGGVASLDAYDYAKARQTFTSLAQQGDTQAETWLGRMAEEGLGIPADGAQAVAWFGKAADAGSPEAARCLGELYLHGDLVLQDVGDARHFLTQAALHHDPQAARDLGALYQAGLGVTQDPKQAYAWLSIAASSGDRAASSARDKLLVTLTSSDAAQAQSLAQATLRSISAPQEPVKSAEIPPKLAPPIS